MRGGFGLSRSSRRLQPLLEVKAIAGGQGHCWKRERIAVRLRVIPYNPCAALNKPKVVRKEVRPLEPEQCHDLIAPCQAHRLGDLIVLAAMTGLRKGELFALEWNAVNLSEGVVVVRRTLQELNGLTLKEPKTAAGRRVISLDQIAIDALKSRLIKALDQGINLGQLPIVFPNLYGGHMRGSNFDRNVSYPRISRASRVVRVS